MKIPVGRNQPGSAAPPEGCRIPKPFRLPPADFDIRQASARELAAFGLPPRPNAETHPRSRLLWEELAERRPRFVDPRWKHVERVRTPGVRDVQSALFDGAPPELRPFTLPWARRFIDNDVAIARLLASETSTNWCGAYVKRPPVPRFVLAESLRVVAGRWTVPSASVPTSNYFAGQPMNGSYTCAVWVGIDGTAGSTDVLQAGTNSVVTANGGEITGTSYFAWIEWSPLVSIPKGLAVSPGDLISCTVCAPMGGNTNGSALLANLTTNEIVSYRIDPRPHITLAGNVAEWIVEDPSQADGSGLFPLANFGQVVFTDCSAGTQNHELNIDDSIFIDLVDSAQQLRAQAYYLNRSSLRCQFVK
jgi:Peptidase A4 family